MRINFLGRLVDDLSERASRGRDGVPEPYFGNGTGGVPAADTPERLPADSRVAITAEGGLFRLVIPRAGLGSPGMLAGGGFSVFWLGFVAFWTFSALRMGAPVFFPLFSLPFWAVGIFMARTLLKPALSSVDLTMSRTGGLIFEERFLSPRTRSWPLDEVGACRVENAAVTQRGRRDRELVLEVGTRSLRFGRALSDRERRAIASSVNAWLKAERRA